jgi:hypothetical protein
MGFVALANAQADKSFPTDDEINLLLTQTERAIQQYGSVQEFVETRILGGFLKDEEFGLGGRHALGLE